MENPFFSLDRMQGATSSDIQTLHDASMQILQRAGVCFNHPEALEIFKTHGFDHRNGRVFISENQVWDALKTVPASFEIQARNPEKTILVGGQDPVLLPTAGAPNIADPEKGRRPAHLSDFSTCCALVETSGQLNMGGWLMVQPQDIPVGTAHLDMLFTYLTRCTKPLLGAFGSAFMAQDTFEMAGMIFGGTSYLKSHPVTAMVVNAMSPLKFSRDQTDVLIMSSRLCQPVVISNMALCGSTAPVRLPGLLAMINAEILAGMVLSQLAGPGTPVVYGTTSAPMDMKTLVGVVGAWETVKISAIAVQLARFYKMPCRTGGSLTDAHVPDAQAGAESSLLLSTAMRNGVDFIIHACGQISSFMAVSFEKWLIDEAVCDQVKRFLSPLDISEETIELDAICDAGVTGNFLIHPSTFLHFRELSRSDLFNRNHYTRWLENGAKDVAHVASDRLKKRLASYEPPAMDPGLEQALNSYVARRKKDLLP